MSNGRCLVLDEESFVKLVLWSGYTRREINNIYEISNHIIDTSRILYREKYRDEIRQRKQMNYSLSKQGNTFGKRNISSVLLPEHPLRELIESGKGSWVIATELNTSEFAVRTSAKYYQIHTNTRLPRTLQGLDIEHLQRLSYFVPSIIKDAENYYDNPILYYESLYRAFLDLQELVWFVKEQGRNYSHRRHQVQKSSKEISKLPTHICWSSNYPEMLLARALIDRKIIHYRQLKIGSFIVDFYLPESNLVIELDGTMHNLDSTKQRDINKERYLISSGYNLLRLNSKNVERDVNEAIECILQKIQSYQ